MLQVCVEEIKHKVVLEWERLYRSAGTSRSLSDSCFSSNFLFYKVPSSAGLKGALMQCTLPVLLRPPPHSRTDIEWVFLFALGYSKLAEDRPHPVVHPAPWVPFLTAWAPYFCSCPFWDSIWCHPGCLLQAYLSQHPSPNPGRREAPRHRWYEQRAPWDSSPFEARTAGIRFFQPPRGPGSFRACWHSVALGLEFLNFLMSKRRTMILSYNPDIDRIAPAS